jgi:hypothetical protein
MKQVVMMNSEMINLDDRGKDADWEEAVRRFRAKRDDSPNHVGVPNNLSRYVAEFRSDGTAAHIFAT